MNIIVHTDSIDNMRSIIDALGDSGMPVVFPVHPTTQKCLQEYGMLEGGWNVLVGADKCGIIEAVLGRRPASRQGKIFDCENASERISGIIADISG